MVVNFWDVNCIEELTDDYFGNNDFRGERVTVRDLKNDDAQGEWS